MASVFTYDPDPPKVISPWGLTRTAAHSVTDFVGGPWPRRAVQQQHDLKIYRIDPEPQEGPNEYKLHLLLRPRGASLPVDLTRRSDHTTEDDGSLQTRTEASNDDPSVSNSILAYRQLRLEQLTTQLLWRLQQSSPYHSSSMANAEIPSMPRAFQLELPVSIANLIPGLEESKGALYEIGVADNGSLQGLTDDEMIESLVNLTAMAASLGCLVSVQRMVQLGDANLDVKMPSQNLYVAEALVLPSLRVGQALPAPIPQAGGRVHGKLLLNHYVEQARFSLIGVTACGKSSLLGTLSTSTLDNGRGKSRLSLLKHRHEIASGLTSSVVQELVGYETEGASHYRVLNYANESIKTWNDIHASSHVQRLALLSDSAGHPRFRRTTVRGLIGWMPHWTLLCIAANERPETAQDHDPSSANAHVSMSHLDLCLKLMTPFVIVVTKLDEASKSGLRQLLSALLTRLKEAGRRPVVLSGHVSESDKGDELKALADDPSVEIELKIAEHGPRSAVFILLTSAVSGSGIAQLHTLLRCLPLSTQEGSDQGRSIFAIDDSFSNITTATGSNEEESVVIVSGIMSRGAISVQDVLFVGPFPASVAAQSALYLSHEAPSPALEGTAEAGERSFLSPRSFKDALARTTSSPRLGSIEPAREWRRAKVVSVRNLRLPVQKLQRDQVGTIGMTLLEDESNANVADPNLSRSATFWPTVRKGMVLVSDNPTASHTFTAKFVDQEATSLIIGTTVIVYCATLRASARVVAIALDTEPANDSSAWHEDGMFDFDGDGDAGPPQDPKSITRSVSVTFQFVVCKETVERGAKVLVMLSGGGGPGQYAGLDGHVGCITETFS